MTATETCPVCGLEGLTLPQSAPLEDGLLLVLVVTDLGTAYPHVRDVHPEHWQEMCARQRLMNRTPATYLSRKVNGTFLLEGEDVGDI